MVESITQIQPEFSEINHTLPDGIGIMCKMMLVMSGEEEAEEVKEEEEAAGAAQVVEAEGTKGTAEVETAAQVVEAAQVVGAAQTVGATETEGIPLKTSVCGSKRCATPSFERIQM
jgi:hypothetical protein